MSKTRAILFIVAIVLLIAAALVFFSRRSNLTWFSSSSSGRPATPLASAHDRKDTNEGSKQGQAEVLENAADSMPSAISQKTSSPRSSATGPGDEPENQPATLATATTAAAICRVSGMVTDENGKPLQNIGIYRLRAVGLFLADSSQKITSFEDFSPDLLARTNADGEYSTTTAPVGQGWLAAYDPQYAFPLVQGVNPRSVAMEAGGKQGEINFQLLRAFSISGTVMDHLRKPVQGATVKIRVARFPKGYQPVLPLKATSDAQGRYELKSLPAGSYALAAALRGYAEDAKADVPAGSQNVDFVIAPESGIRGRVTIAGTGEPVAGLMVIATGGGMSRGGGYAKAEVILKPGHATTDSKGFYEIKNLNAGLNPVVVAKHQYNGKTLVAPTREVELAVGEIKEGINFALTEGLSISGRVTEKGSGKPLAGATVISIQENNSKAVTDSQGNYQISGIRPRRQFLRVEAPGHVMKYILGYNEQGACCAVNIHRQLDVLDGQSSTGIDFEMDPAATLMGRVVDQKGEPLQNADISLLNDSGLAFNHEWRGRFKTDSKGIYKISDVNEGSFYIKAILPGYATGRSGLLSANIGGVTQVPDVVLSSSGATLSGRITGSGSSLLANAAVKVVQLFESAKARGSTAWETYHTCGETRSDKNGNYDIQMIGRGPVEIQVSASGYGLATKRITIEDLSKKYSEDFALGGTTVIAGVVKDAKGTPLPNAMVLATALDQPNEQSMDGVSSKADGSFRLEKIGQDMKYSLEITLGGFASQRLSGIPAGKEDVAVTMRKCGAIAGKITDSATSAPLKDFALFAVQADSDQMPRLDGEQNKVHSQDGSFSRQNLQPGSYQLIVIAPGYQRFEKGDILIEEEKTTSLGSIGLAKQVSTPTSMD